MAIVKVSLDGTMLRVILELRQRSTTSIKGADPCPKALGQQL
jgi:hypothetical protein